MSRGASPERTNKGKPSVPAPVMEQTVWSERLAYAMRVMALLSLAVATAFVCFKGGPVVAMPILLFVVSLAIAGRGNRWLWSLIFPVLSCAMGAAFLGLYKLMPKEAEFAMSLLAFVLVSVAPAAMLWLAATLKRVRSGRGTVNTHVGEPRA